MTDIDPDTLNLAYKGMMTCFIELPEGYDVSDIMQDSVTLNGTVCAEKAVLSDYDRDGIPDLTVKFDREQVCALLEPGDAVEITVSGAVGDVRFIGTDTVRVIGKKNGNKKAVIPECYEIRNTDRVYFYHLNHLGTPQAVTDEDGNIVWQADYKPFGEAIPGSSSVENSFRFPGQYYDAESGLHYNWHRYYDPKTGRYLTPDPIGLAGGINLYGYVIGNPVNWGDPLGLIITFGQDRQDKLRSMVGELRNNPIMSNIVGYLDNIPQEIKISHVPGYIFKAAAETSYGFSDWILGKPYAGTMINMDLDAISDFLRKLFPHINNPHRYSGEELDNMLSIVALAHELVHAYDAAKNINKFYWIPEKTAERHAHFYEGLLFNWYSLPGRHECLP